MGLKRTTVYLDEDILFLAGYHGITNLSEFFRKCLESIVLAEDEIDRPDLIRSKAMKIALDMKKELRAQRTLLNQESAQVSEAQAYKQARDEAVRQACVTTFLKYKDFGRSIPENDPDLDRTDLFDAAVSHASKLSGHEIDPREVIAIYHKMAGTKPVRSRETDVNTFGIKEVKIDARN